MSLGASAPSAQKRSRTATKGLDPAVSFSEEEISPLMNTDKADKKTKFYVLRAKHFVFPISAISGEVQFLGKAPAVVRSSDLGDFAGPLRLQRLPFADHLLSKIMSAAQVRIISPCENRRDLGHAPQLFRCAFVAQALLPVPMV